MKKSVRKEVCVDSGQMAVMPAFGKYLNKGEDEHCMCVLPAAKGEKYTAFVEHSDEGSWGMRVKRLVVMRGEGGYVDNAVKVGSFKATSEKLIVSDPCYVFEDDYGANGPYDRACNATYDRKVDKCTEMRANLFESLEPGSQGVCSSSGYGDGGYDLHAECDEKGLVFAEVVFIPEEEEDDEWDEDEDEE